MELILFYLKHYKQLFLIKWLYHLKGKGTTFDGDLKIFLKFYLLQILVLKEKIALLSKERMLKN